MTEQPAGGAGDFWRGVGVVAATYTYFLLFAQFAFLEQAGAVVAGESTLRGLMAAMGAGGIAGSVAATWRLAPENFVRRLARSFAACAVVAALTPLAAGRGTLLLASAAIGLGLGWNTVTLAAGLRALLPASRLGLGAGLGTGLAYALCNVPAVFTASPKIQAWLSAGVAALAAAALLGARPAWPDAAGAVRATVWRWVLVFLALVWLDSAAFYIVQHTPALRTETWTGAGLLWSNACVHWVAAVVAGVLLDRGWLRGLAGASWVLLALACLGLKTFPAAGFNLLYAAGVSAYSAALIWFTARAGRARVAATLFSIAGWIGSALGIGMAQDLHGVPTLFLLVSGVGLLVAVGPRAAALAALAIGCVTPPARAEAAAGLAARGREVYLAEGCINCHSQYVRPGVALDVERWGPVRPLEELLREEPPLFGNRRQGPDLTNVGNRRAPEWNRLHLQAPRALSPGSRMPSYAHLFAAGDERGEALVAYLASLGAGTEEARGLMVQSWRPDPQAIPVSGREAARLFAGNCAQCHGPEGRGNGALADRLPVRPPDWSHDAWRRVPGGDEEVLARLIKFGAAGTAMPGHETLTDGEIAGLARQVKALHTPAVSP